ncbi:MAG: hypothetical protein ACE5OS_13850 [Anaerolineae bacterium]
MDIQHGIPATPPPAETEDEETLIRREAGLFLQFLQADPGARAYIDRTIRQHLQDGVGLETWQNILGGLTVYAGEDITHFMLMTLLSAEELLNPDEVLSSDDTGILALVEKQVGPEVWSYLRGLMALYSADLREAYEVSGQNVQGWRTVNRRVYYDHLAEAWRATFEIIKFGGERVYLDETPTSAIVLCQAILDALNSVPVEAAQQVANREAVEGLVGLFYTFVEHFAPDLLEEGEDD